MFHRHLAHLRKDQKGAAAVEFALWTTAFFFAVMAVMDFGMYFMYRGKLSTAVGAVAIASYNDPENVSFNTMEGYVQSLSGYADAEVTLSCNGVANSCTNLSRTCACLKSDASFVSASCGTTCSGTGVTSGSTAGYYFTVTATRPYTPLILPNSALSGATMSQMATVRLE
jgi:Flp pilus assembly protein TadG